MLRVVSAPIQRWTQRQRYAAGAIAVLVCLLRAVYTVFQNESVFVMADARFYMGIATGDYSQVIQPFASRQLGALVVAGLAHATHWSIERSFVMEAGLSMVLLLAIVYFILLHTEAPRWLLLAIAIVPFWGTLLQYLVLPDLWFSALLAVLLLLLASEHLLLASLMMFPLMLSRESTSLTLVCFLIAAWRNLRWRDRGTAVVSAIGGAMLVNHLASHAASNVERLPQAVYMLAKVPWNFLHNILGIVPWSNVYPGLCTAPSWSTPLHFGPVRSVGVCGFSTNSWEFLAQAILTNFGLLPLLFVFLWRHRRRSNSRSVLLKFALLYGATSLFLAPLLGVWFIHLIGYAWPLFFVALPLLFNEVPALDITGSRAVAGLAFLCVHLAAFWVSYRWMWVPQISVEFLLWIVGYLLLRHWFGSSSERPVHAEILSQQAIRNY